VLQHGFERLFWVMQEGEEGGGGGSTLVLLKNVKLPHEDQEPQSFSLTSAMILHIIISHVSALYIITSSSGHHQSPELINGL